MVQRPITAWEQKSANVKELGEVYTPDDIVVKMLDLLNDKSIDKTEADAPLLVLLTVISCAGGGSWGSSFCGLSSISSGVGSVSDGFSKSSSSVCSGEKSVCSLFSDN